MRTNLPVTQQAYEFSSSETLLSTTDAESRISYANAPFIRTSGFDSEELMGQPHNIVRHPDMPVEAFAPDGHFNFPHLWPVKLPHGRTLRL